MKHQRAGHARRLVESADDLSGLRRIRVTGGGQHHPDMRFLAKAGRPRRQRTRRRRAQQPRQIFVQPRHDDLRLGVAKPHVELDHFRAVRGEHQPDVQEAPERMPLALHAVEHRLNDLVEHPPLDVGRQPRGRRERAHPSRVRPTVVVEDPLVILGRRQRHASRAVGEHEVRRFFADQELFEHDAVAGGTKAAIDHRRTDRLVRRRTVFGNDDTLACGEAVGLEHDRIAELTGRDRARARRPRSRTRENARSARGAAP